MLNLSVKLYLLATTLIEFDPDIVSVVTSFFGVAGKYGMLFGILGVLLTMLVRAFTGKEKFL